MPLQQLGSMALAVQDSAISGYFDHVELTCYGPSGSFQVPAGRSIVTSGRAPSGTDGVDFDLTAAPPQWSFSGVVSADVIIGHATLMVDSLAFYGTWGATRTR